MGGDHPFCAQVPCKEDEELITGDETAVGGERHQPVGIPVMHHRPAGACRLHEVSHVGQVLGKWLRRAGKGSRRVAVCAVDRNSHSLQEDRAHRASRPVSTVKDHCKVTYGGDPVEDGLDVPALCIEGEYRPVSVPLHTCPGSERSLGLLLLVSCER